MYLNSGLASGNTSELLPVDGVFVPCGVGETNAQLLLQFHTHLYTAW